ncbi:DUF2157 domain-containing protein [Sphaerisporangium dianthi]|uniref:DUF2157 domain-containing protein n=1 Tax=Sphaerisporangium dianthi TaxID=1436120 RepID=A0ABV9CP76_9ACTN
MEPTRVRVPARRLAWLHGELARWQAEGVIDTATAQRVSGRYVAGRRLSLERVVLSLGGGFLGVGLIWIVAANLDRLSPLTRFAGITLVWIAAAVLGEVLAGPAARSAARLVAVSAAGGVIFQAAQSLQVPAYSSSLLGVWAGGALAYAYATRAAGPLVAAVAIGSVWYGWWVGEQTDAAGGIAASLVAAGAAAISLAVLHERRPAGPASGERSAREGAADGGAAGEGATGEGAAGEGATGGGAAGGGSRWAGAGPWSARFAGVWRLTGYVLILTGLFVAAFPGVSRQQMYGSVAFWAAFVAAAVAVGAALAFGDPEGRREVLAVPVVVVAALCLVAWAPGGMDTRLSGFTAEQTARAVAGTLVYILVASWSAVVAARRDAAHLVVLATVALVVFVTAQSFAVFQPLLSGAALFLALGVIFIVTGILVEYGRRRLMEATR